MFISWVQCEQQRRSKRPSTLCCKAPFVVSRAFPFIQAVSLGVGKKHFYVRGSHFHILVAGLTFCGTLLLPSKSRSESLADSVAK